MANDFMVVGIFVVALIVICKIWNFYMMKQYKKAKEQIKCESKMSYGNYTDSIGKLELLGTGIDGNGDYNVSAAIERIELSSNVRIRINE